MTVAAVLLPVFVQVGLTFFILFRLGPLRFGAVRRGEINGDPTLDERAWPDKVRQASNAFRNQFEVPVLYFVLVVLALLTRKADLIFVVLSWVFVLSRLAHAFVHLTSNNVRYRFPAYLVGVVVLLLMWVLFALSILFAPVLP
ncbi:MAPEG family protein [Ancylobacter lacus]|uniref:MAPEG family protein n=1 Tax=Ancylobacter lacus TaxID=2579970 RepID=UPI001BCCF96E|nr:MAPEG family protein [Ancylobacter lacus]MBS7541367.1 MAPEG family protein [Ancylobacter lacus]